jgi:hypothetical protein
MNKPGSERQRSYVFSTCGRAKYKYKHYHIYMHIYVYYIYTYRTYIIICIQHIQSTHNICTHTEHIPKVEQLEETKGGGKEENNDTE